jgi:regulatory protein YycI of two-component signal transduction system YycFG
VYEFKYIYIYICIHIFIVYIYINIHKYQEIITVEETIEAVIENNEKLSGIVDDYVTVIIEKNSESSPDLPHPAGKMDIE